MDKEISKVGVETVEDTVMVNQEGVLKCEVTDISHTSDTITFGVTSRRFVYSSKRITVPFEGGSKYFPFNRVNGSPVSKTEPVYAHEEVDIPFCESRVDTRDGETVVVVTLLDDSEITLGIQEFRDWMA